MNTLHGEWLIKNASSSVQSREHALWQELAFLAGLGMTAVMLHATFRWSLNLPGHHGLEWMALFVIGRATSQLKWAATVSSLGASGCALLPIWGFDDPFMWLIYFLPGLVMDFGYNMGNHWQHKIWFFAILGGMAHAIKPIARVIISTINGWPYGSLLFGVAYPLATHIFFGIAGALAGVGLLRLMKWRIQQ